MISIKKENLPKFCRVCGVGLNPNRYFHDLKLYCSLDCKEIYTKQYNKNKAKEISDKAKQLKNDKQPLLIKEPEFLDDYAMNTLVPINEVIFSGDTQSNYLSRSRISQKIRHMKIPSELKTIEMELVVTIGFMPKKITRKYKVVHITPLNFFKLVEYHRNLYNETKSYTNLNSYQNIIKDCQILFNHVKKEKIKCINCC